MLQQNAEYMYIHVYHAILQHAGLQKTDFLPVQTDF